LNGRLGTILSYISNCDRYAVQIEGSGECVRLRSDTVGPIESKPADAPTAGALVEAARAGQLKKLRNLVKLGADVNGTGLGRGGRPISAAAVEDQLECLCFLLDQGADPNAPNAYGSTALHDASYNGAPKCVDELLRRGAAANAADGNGNTPLIAACAAGHVGIVKALVAHGAKVSEKAFSANRAGTHTNQASIEEALLGTTSELAAHGRDEPSDAWKAAQGASAALQALLAATTSAALREALLVATPFAEVPAISQALPRARQRLKELKLAGGMVPMTARGTAAARTCCGCDAPISAAFEMRVSKALPPARTPARKGETRLSIAFVGAGPGAGLPPSCSRRGPPFVTCAGLDRCGDRLCALARPGPDGWSPVHAGSLEDVASEDAIDAPPSLLL
jgi:hypothetical protein